MTHEQPIAVFEGRAWLRHAPVALLAAGLAATVLGIAVADYVPWPTALGLGQGGMVLLLWTILGAASVLVTLWAGARVGRAELFADRLVIMSGQRFATVFLSELDAFDDRSSELVRVEGRSTSVPTGTLFVPTSDDAGRTALLEALNAAGVPRDDGQATTPRAGAPAAPLALAHVSPVLRGRGVIWLVGGLLAVLMVSLMTPCVLTPALAVLLLGAVFWASRRTWTIRFDADRIVLDARGDRSPARSTIAWSDVLAWRSTAPDELRLILRSGLVRDAHGQPRVPTPTPELRAVLEALFAERGVKRL